MLRKMKKKVMIMKKSDENDIYNAISEIALVNNFDINLDELKENPNEEEVINYF